MYRKIVLAYDGSREGRVVLREGADIAQRCQAEAHLLAVMRLPFAVPLAEGFNPQDMVKEELQHYQDILDEGVALLRERGLSAEGHLVQGDPVAQITTFAREIGADLIVVGHRSRGALARWWSGSVGVSLVDHAPCSILVAVTAAPGDEAARELKPRA